MSDTKKPEAVEYAKKKHENKKGKLPFYVPPMVMKDTTGGLKPRKTGDTVIKVGIMDEDIPSYNKGDGRDA